MDDTLDDIQADTQEDLRIDARVYAWLDTLEDTLEDTLDDKHAGTLDGTLDDDPDDTLGDTQEITLDEGHIRQDCLPKAETQLGQFLSIEDCEPLSPTERATNNIPARTSIVGEFRPGAAGSAIRVKQANRDVVYKVVRIHGVGSGLGPSTSPENAS